MFRLKSKVLSDQLQISVADCISAATVR